jgi:membrane protein DedA with SNARE-associated domain
MYSEEAIFAYLAYYAYQPLMIYSIIIIMMVLSAFGLPIPEEVTIITVAILAHMGANPDLFPPPYPDAPTVNAWVASVVCVGAVLFSDLIVYSIGHRSGKFLEKSPRFEKIFKNGKMQKIQDLTQRHGIWAVFAFRFMPGVRFPGHLFCGMMDLKLWKFMIMDAFAAVISIPTQLVLVAIYGRDILGTLYKFKVYVGWALALVILFAVSKRLWQWWATRTSLRRLT